MSEGDAAGDREYLYDVVRSRLDSVAWVPAPYGSLDDLLGNVRYRTDSPAAAAATDLDVVGNVISVEQGRGYRAAKPGDDPARVLGDGFEVGFEDPAALWRTLHLKIRVTEVLSGDGARPGDLVTVGESINGPASTDADRAVRGFEAVGRAVWFLESGSPVYAYDRSVYAVSRSGGLLAPVDGEGTISLPLAGDVGLEQLLEAVPTLDELRAAATRPSRVVTLVERDGYRAREGAAPAPGPPYASGGPAARAISGRKRSS